MHNTELIGIIVSFVIAILITVVFTRTEMYKPSTDDNIAILTLLSCSLFITSILIAFVITNLYNSSTIRANLFDTIIANIRKTVVKYSESNSDLGNLLQYTKLLKRDILLGFTDESDETYKLKDKKLLGYETMINIHTPYEFIYMIYIIMFITIVGFWFVRIGNPILHFIVNLIVISIFVFSIFAIWYLSKDKIHPRYIAKLDMIIHEIEQVI